MRSKAFTTFLATAGFLTALATSTHAIDKPNQATPVRPTKMAPVKLSESECTQLGGEVLDVSSMGICNSGKACKTTDQNQKLHMVCVTKQ